MTHELLSLHWHGHTLIRLNYPRTPVFLLTCTHTHQTILPTNVITHELLFLYWHAHTLIKLTHPRTQSLSKFCMFTNVHAHLSNAITHEHNDPRTLVSVLTCNHTWISHERNNPRIIVSSPTCTHPHRDMNHWPTNSSIVSCWHAHTLVFVGSWVHEKVVLKLIEITHELNHCLFSDMHTPTSRTQSPTNTITHELKTPRIPISVLTCTHTHRFGVIYLCYIYICTYV